MSIYSARWVGLRIEADEVARQIPGGYSLLVVPEQYAALNVGAIPPDFTSVVVRTYRQDGQREPDLVVPMGQQLKWEERKSYFQIYLYPFISEGQVPIVPGTGCYIKCMILVGTEPNDVLTLPSIRDSHGFPMVNAVSTGFGTTTTAFQLLLTPPGTETLISGAGATIGGLCRERLVQNLGPNAIYIGPTGVTTANGFEVPSGGGVVSVPGSFELYGVAAVADQVAPADTRVLEIY